MRTSILAVMVIIGCASTATAAPITFNFTATQISAQTPGGLASLAAPFSTITGSFTYDTAVAASSSTALIATYPTGTLVVDQFNVGTGVFVAPFSITVVNNAAVGGDQFALGTGGVNAGTPVGVYDVVRLNLIDATLAALSSTALPTSLSLFPVSRLRFDREEITAGGITRPLGSTIYNLTSLQGAPSAVPEPATLILLGSGLAAAGLRRRMLRRA